jgi:hypothetical protein
MARFRTRQARNAWDRLARARILNQIEFVSFLRDEHARTGRREIEMSQHASKSGRTELISF